MNSSLKAISDNSPTYVLSLRELGLSAIKLGHTNLFLPGLAA